MDEILNSWNMAALIPVFQANNITEEVLRKMNLSLMKELIPNIGLRIQFLERPQTQMNIVPCTPLADITFTDLLDENLSDASTSTTITTVSTVGSEIEGVQTDNQKSEFPDFDLKTLLVTSPLGNSVINFYNTYNNLDNTRRNRLVDIIMKHLFKYHVTHYLIHNFFSRLKYTDYNVVAAKIITLFPTEAIQVYYIPSVEKRDSPTGHTVVAKGKLVDKARNLIHRSGVSIRKRKRSESDEPSNKNILTFSEDCVNSLTFLRTRTDPWDEVIQHWEETYHMRRNDNMTTLKEFLDKWSILDDPRSKSLIEFDFDKMYKGVGLKFHQNWKKFFKELISIRKCREEFEGNDLNENGQLANYLLILPKLIPPRGRKVVDSKVWKFTIQESIESIIIHSKVP